MKKNVLLTFVSFFVLAAMAIGQAPRITYTEPEKDDSRRTEYEIIGKISGNFLVYKSNRGTNDICVYDADMKLKERVPLNYLKSDRLINVDFIAYPDFVYLVYQYEKRGIVYCSLAKLDANAKTLIQPVQLDTTQIGFAGNNKIYTMVNSDDKQKIMLFKINGRNSKNFLFTTMLYDEQFLLQKKTSLNIGMEEKNDFFSDFLLTNDGDLVFCKSLRTGSGTDAISKVSLVTKATEASEFKQSPVPIGTKILDEIKIKIDNTNKRVLLSSFYYKQKRGNIEGIFLVNIDAANPEIIRDTAYSFDDELRGAAKSPDVSKKLAFNDFYIKNIIVRRDGGFLLITESLYSSSRGTSYNRWDYLGYGSPWRSMDYYYSPYNNPWFMPWNRYGAGQSTRYFSDNIMLLSFGKDGGFEWSNVVTKSQYDDETDNMISHVMMNTGGDLHFLFNQYERRTLILNDQSIGADGKVARNPTLKNLDKGYEFMPRYGKQVSGRQMILPCMYRNYLCFAKIDY